MTPQDSIALITTMFAAFCQPDTSAAKLARFFTPDYIQRVDGKQLDLTAFLDHFRALQAALRRLNITIEHVVSDGTTAATVHIAEAEKRDGSRSRIKVVAVYVLRDGRIALVDELTRVLDGAAGDADLGSLGTTTAAA